MKKKRLTIQHLAKQAKVSVATISRSLNTETRSKVAPETLRLVDNLIKKSNYTPNITAKRLRQSSYKTIGLLFPHHAGIFRSEYYSEILSGVSDYLLESEYSLKMILLKPEQYKWDTYDFKSGEGVDGLIMTYWRTFFSSESAVNNFSFPCVIVNNVEKGIKSHFVAGDHFQGGEMAAQYLYKNGHRKIAVFTGSKGAPDVQRRLEGFRSFLKKKNVSLEKDALWDTEFKEEKAYQMAGELLSRRPGTTALFCMNDTLAIGALKKLRELGVNCPGEISVMGYDNDRRSEYTQPPLTTIRVPVYEAAKKAAQQLITYLKNKDKSAFFNTELLPVSLVERRSVARKS